MLKTSSIFSSIGQFVIGVLICFVFLSMQSHTFDLSLPFYLFFWLEFILSAQQQQKNSLKISFFIKDKWFQGEVIFLYVYSIYILYSSIVRERIHIQIVALSDNRNKTIHLLNRKENKR